MLGINGSVGGGFGMDDAVWNVVGVGEAGRGETNALVRWKSVVESTVAKIM